MNSNTNAKYDELAKRSAEAKELMTLIDILQNKQDEYLQQIQAEHLSEIENLQSKFNKEIGRAREKSEIQKILFSIIESKLSLLFDLNLQINSKLEKCERESSSLRIEISSLKRKFNKVIESKSWRYTKYFRSVLALITQTKYEPVKREEIIYSDNSSIELDPSRSGYSPEIGTEDKRDKIESIRHTELRFDAAPKFSPNKSYVDRVSSFQISNPLLLSLEKTPSKINLTISVIIPTFNAGNEFKLLLKRLNSQVQIGGLEIIVVDSGSTDNTLSIANAHKCKILKIPQTSFSHSYARNLGAEKATGDLLLFMVQDASPIGAYWINSLVNKLQSKDVAALSASEFCKYDTDLIYALGVDTQYRFLGCWDKDRLGKLNGMDAENLRKNGQLSDLTLLIKRSLFNQFKYKGDYGEDLILGVDLIKNAHSSLFLSSIKVIHSHYRSSWYYFKRGFVDINFLKTQFTNLDIPKPSKIEPIFTAIVRFHNCLSLFLYISHEQKYISIEDYFNTCISFVEQDPRLGNTHFPIKPNDPKTEDAILRLRSWIDFNQLYNNNEDYNRFKIELINRIMHLKLFVTRVSEGAYLTPTLKSEITESLAKIFASHAGMFIGYTFKSNLINEKMENYQNLRTLTNQLVKGV